MRLLHRHKNKNNINLKEMNTCVCDDTECRQRCWQTGPTDAPLLQHKASDKEWICSSTPPLLQYYSDKAKLWTIAQPKKVTELHNKPHHWLFCNPDNKLTAPWNAQLPDLYQTVSPHDSHASVQRMLLITLTISWLTQKDSNSCSVHTLAKPELRGPLNTSPSLKNTKRENFYLQS